MGLLYSLSTLYLLATVMSNTRGMRRKYIRHMYFILHTILYTKLHIIRYTVLTVRATRGTYTIQNMGRYRNIHTHTQLDN